MLVGWWDAFWPCTLYFSAVHTLLFGRAHLAFRPSICLRDFGLYCLVICTIFAFRPCTLCFSAVHTLLTYVLTYVLTYALNVALTYVLFWRQSLGLRGRLVVELFVRRWYLTRRCIYCGSCDVWDLLFRWSCDVWELLFRWSCVGVVVSRSNVSPDVIWAEDDEVLETIMTTWRRIHGEMRWDWCWDRE